MPTPATTRNHRSISGSTWPSAVCGAKRFTAGKRPSSSIPSTPRRTTTSQLPTSTRGNSTKPAARTTRRWPSSPTTRRFVRTTTSSRKSMTALAPKRNQIGRRLASLAIAGVSGLVVVACGPSYFEIPIETPIQAKLDVSAFQRVLIAGFVAGGSDDVDANQETVRLLRSQLRTKSSLKVIDADIMELAEIAREQLKSASETEDAAEPRDADQTPAPSSA